MTIDAQKLTEQDEREQQEFEAQLEWLMEGAEAVDLAD